MENKIIFTKEQKKAIMDIRRIAQIDCNGIGEFLDSKIYFAYLNESYPKIAEEITAEQQERIIKAFQLD